jgi:hypothetical protein
MKKKIWKIRKRVELDDDLLRFGTRVGFGKLVNLVDLDDIFG